MTATPLTDKALQKLRGYAEGNHLDPAEIVLLGSDERTLTVNAEVLFTLDIQRVRTSYAGPLQQAVTKAVQKVPNAGALDNLAEQLKTRTAASDAWAKEMDKRLKAEIGEGWGSDNEEFPLTGMAQLYYTQDNCGACAGQGNSRCGYCQGEGYVNCQRCQATGLEICVNCNGSGLNSAYPDQYCSYCNGATQMHCRDCNGTRKMECNQCRGRGQMVCGGCNGQRYFTMQEIMTPAVRCDFRIPDSGDLPSGFRRAISRAGFKSLAKGHATIKAGVLSQHDNKQYFVPYTATLPYAELRLKIKGARAIGAVVFGKKALILDLPPFLDAVLEPVVAAHEAAAHQNGVFNKALETHALREAFTLIQNGQSGPEALRRYYPAGLSQALMARMMNLIQKLIEQQTMLVRMVAGVASLILAAFCGYVIIQTGVRVIIAQHAAPIAAFIFDIVCMGLLCLLQHGVIHAAAGWQLRRALGHAMPVHAKALNSGKLGLFFGVGMMLIYVAVLFLLGALPSWPAILAKPF